ncbi:MAG: hypothetical protein DSZ29_03965 [Aquificaceae bacterium]|nr:MAG: hypothetical protein DSZ29_03965 [Aquificaceae bacterium]
MNNIISVDSLTDIISNSVGILIIFAVISLINDNNKAYQLEIPIEHSSDLSPVFVIAKNDALLVLNTDKLFTNAAMQATEGAAKRKRSFPLDYGHLLGEIDKRKGLIFHVEDIEGSKDWHHFNTLEKPTSALKDQLSLINPKKQFAYFFVYDEVGESSISGSGFEAFRKAREYLKSRGVKSGWKPVDSNNPANICDVSFSPLCRYLPSYLGSS